MQALLEKWEEVKKELETRQVTDRAICRGCRLNCKCNGGWYFNESSCPRKYRLERHRKRQENISRPRCTRRFW